VTAPPKHYRVAGGRLRSAVVFPDLARARPGEPDWTFAVGETGPPDPGRVQGERTVQPGWTLRLLQAPGGWRFEFGPAGSFDLASDTVGVTWCPGRVRANEVVRSVLTGPVLGLSLHERGFLCLHGSAVRTAEGVIGFLAPKHYGKSTLALALMMAWAGPRADSAGVGSARSQDAKRMVARIGRHAAGRIRPGYGQAPPIPRPVERGFRGRAFGVLTAPELDRAVGVVVEQVAVVVGREGVPFHDAIAVVVGFVDAAAVLLFEEA